MICGKAECGLQYAVKRSSGAVGYCSLSIKCGTRDEAGYHIGIAHFAEHTIFKGTKGRSTANINSCLDKLGGELNAYTTKEEIVLHSTVLKEDLHQAGSVLMDLATRPLFPENEIETEKSVVIDEINSYKDSPGDDVYDRFEEAIFKGHPLGQPILGTADSVNSITCDELHRFVKEKFLPSRMAFSIVADIDEAKMEKEVLRLVKKYFGESKSQAPTSERILSKPEPILFDQTIDKHNHEVNAVIGGIAPSLYEERERLATVLMSNILGGPSANAILNDILREKKGWVYGVECSYTQYSDTGILAICLGCDKENLQKCFRAIDKALARLQNEPLSERKLKAAKKQLLGQLAISSDNGETQCLSMGKSLLSFGRIASDEENKKKIESITAEEIQAIAKKIFSAENTSRLIFL
jgi:predicted Zn-dependent peptidase